MDAPAVCLVIYSSFNQRKQLHWSSNRGQTQTQQPHHQTDINKEHPMSVQGFLEVLKMYRHVISLDIYLFKELHILLPLKRRTPEHKCALTLLPKRPFPFPKAKLFSEPTQSALQSQFLIRTLTWLPGINEVVCYFLVFGARSSFTLKGIMLKSG